MKNLFILWTATITLLISVLMTKFILTKRQWIQFKLVLSSYHMNCMTPQVKQLFRMENGTLFYSEYIKCDLCPEGQI